VWDGTTPALLVAGGSGVVPVMAMLRAARRTGRTDLVRMVVSARSPEELYYAAELPGPETTVVYTRRNPPGTERPPGRLTAEDLPQHPG
jgi:ferredoxin-NADP reductase